MAICDVYQPFVDETVAIAMNVLKGKIAHRVFLGVGRTVSAGGGVGHERAFRLRERQSATEALVE